MKSVNVSAEYVPPFTSTSISCPNRPLINVFGLDVNRFVDDNAVIVNGHFLNLACAVGVQLHDIESAAECERTRCGGVGHGHAAVSDAAGIVDINSLDVGCVGYELSRGEIYFYSKNLFKTR